ncbi:Nramp family divalent metal transporter [Armatimonas sp.]|uniref:Nramp family divalent metal transporter n=1 Tax=Armatimonas sp. TaxID=1872638 RepID=UPI00286A3680|nr:Nramp family divalent metal transporter [Armatimonas sp.]
MNGTDSTTDTSLPSLPEVYRSVSVPKTASPWRRLLAFAGPGYLVSVGYMDPGNWGTDIAGGAKYGYQLLWVILASNLMAILLQTLCARLGLVTGKDLAQACRDYYKKPAAIALWLLCEVAIIACDLAEVIGSAVALNLLLGVPLLVGVLITGLDVLILLGLMRFGFRKIEALIITLVGTIAVCFALQLFYANPDWGGIGRGLITPQLPDKEALFIALGILGATVMPHNLYLHSSIVQTRAYEKTAAGLRHALRSATADTVVALGMAFFVNAAILVVAAAAFHAKGQFEVAGLEEAHVLLKPMLGGAAATAFAIALLASGQSSTITGTLAGQIVMEGFLNLHIAPWLRRLITRSLAIIPAMILIGMSGGKNTVHLLTLSQVVLSMQLSFAIFPLLAFTSDKKRMGEYVNPLWLKLLGLLVCLLIAGLNIKYLVDSQGLLPVLSGAALMAAFAVWVQWGYKGKPEVAKPLES